MNRTWRVTARVVLLAAILLGHGCSGEDLSEKTVKGTDTSLSPSGKLVITGSSTMAPMVAEIGKHFQMRYPAVQVEVLAGGSVRGINDIRQGASDIGMVSRALKDDEKDLFGFPVARDGICLILNRDNPLDVLTVEQVVGIYTGKVTNWKEVGGKDSPIFVVNRSPEGRPSVELFIRYFGIKYADIKAQLTVGDNPEAINAVAGNPDAIVSVSVGEAQRNAEKGIPIKPLPVEGVAANGRNVRNGSYAISRSLSLVTKELPKGLARAFIEFALSSQVTDIAKRHDFVPYLD